MDAANVEISGNNSNTDSEEFVSYIIMVFQFLPSVILAFLALFNNRDLKGEIIKKLIKCYVYIVI